MVEVPSAVDPASSRRLRLALAAALIAGLLARASVVFWDRPWEPHHPDEHILALEAVALWEGITPREVGWPATTTRLALSGISGAAWLSEEGTHAWSVRDNPAQALTTLTHWIGAQFVDPSASYRRGRLLSAVTGILQLAAAAWMLRGWTGSVGAAAGTFALALSPIVVLHSQFVLADITGLLCATLALGRITSSGYRQVVVAAAFAGLAAASKVHFGLWLLAPLLAIVTLPDVPVGRRLQLTLAAVTAFGVIFLALFPWAWTNPVLAAKEFLGVVAVKVGTTPASGLRLIANLRMLFGSTGTLVWLGALLGVASVRRVEWRGLIPVVVPVVLGAVVLGRSTIVFDRYSMVLVPGLSVLAAMGWERGLMTSGTRSTAARAVAAVALAATLVSLVSAERTAAEADVDTLARAWILANVPRGARVAVHDENNATLPRSRAQLTECASGALSADAYRRKWEMLGYAPPADGQEPMRAMLLNDETSFAYWCQRELDAQTDPGFTVVPYHADARSNAVLEADAVAEFASGESARTGGIDAIVVNRRLDLAGEPRVVITTQRGARFVYTR